MNKAHNVVSAFVLLKVVDKYIKNLKLWLTIETLPKFGSEADLSLILLLFEFIFAINPMPINDWQTK